MAFILKCDENGVESKWENLQTPYLVKKCNEQSHTYVCCEFSSVGDELLTSKWNNDNNLLPKYETYLAVKTDIKRRKIYIANSISGLIPAYYYCKNGRFCISDNFWEAINYIKPTKDDLDIECIKEFMAIPYPLLNRTFIKNVNILLPNTLLEISIDTLQIKSKRLFNISYTNDKHDLDDELESFYKNLDSLFGRIKKECGNVNYGVGISGGIDSRIIPHFAQKNFMKIKGFIFGVKRPHYFWISQDHSNARKIARKYNIPLMEITWDHNTLDEKLEQEMKVYPLGSSELFKFEFVDDFDVLIHGGNGYVVGSSLPPNIKNMDDKELASAIRKLGILFYPKSLISARIEKIVQYLFKKNIIIRSHIKWFDSLVPEEIEEKINLDIKSFIKQKRDQEYNNIDIFEEYFHCILGAKNKFGAFESICGTKRSFSIYMPYLLKESLSWDFELLQDRTLLKKFISKYLKNLSEIGEQNYKGRIQKKNNTLTRFFSIVKFILKGNGTSNLDEKYFDSAMRKYYETMDSNINGWFYSIFNIHSYIKDIAKFDNPRVATRVWKMKMVLDEIENCSYKRFLINSGGDIVE